MPRPRSSRSDVSDGDIDGMAERELEYQRLQRQYRIMENDRKAYCQESQDIIKRQRSEIEKLEEERETVLKDLRLIESRSNEIKDDKNVDKLGDLGKDKSEIEQEIANEKMKEQELAAEIREWQRKLKSQHKTMGGVHMSTQHTSQVLKNVHKLENQLQLANNSFCKRLEENRKLRDQIDSLRVERRRFDNLRSKLEKKRELLKRDIGEVIDQSTQAYDQRDEAQAKMILLKEKADKDLQQHNAEMKELVRIIDHDRKLRDFMYLKGKEREEDKQLVKWRERKENMELEKKKASQTDSVESYEAAFERIREITGENDLDLLVNKFIESEDINFALFNYVNEQNNEKETIEDSIQKILDEIEKFKCQGIELEEQRKEIQKKLDDRVGLAMTKTTEHEDKLKSVNKIMDQLKAGIESLFNKLGCSRGAIDEMLGAERGITDKNMLQYLGIIEERTNLLLLLQAYVNSQKGDEYGRKQPVLLGEGPQVTAPQIPVQPPTVGDEYESEESEASEDDRPLTRNELTNKVMKSVKRRESAMRKEGFKYDLSDAREKAKKKDKKVR